MLCSATEIRLMPDWTVLPQLGVFLFLLAVLTVFVFKPLERLFERRRRFTSEAAAESARLITEAEQLEIGRRNALAMALDEAHAERARREGESRLQAEGITQQARATAAEILQKGTAEADAAGRRAAAEVDRAAKELAKQIVARVTE